MNEILKDDDISIKCEDAYQPGTDNVYFLLDVCYGIVIHSLRLARPFDRKGLADGLRELADELDSHNVQH
jgi:hypothetical protein